MIYTVTLNPSLDYIVDVENLTVGAINRSTKAVSYTHLTLPTKA